MPRWMAALSLAVVGLVAGLLILAGALVLGGGR